MRLSTIKLVILTWGLVLGVRALAATPVEACDWVVRELWTLEGYMQLGASADVFVTPDEDIVVAGARSNLESGAGDMVLSRLPAGDYRFHEQVETGAGTISSAAADASGTAFYAVQDPFSDALRVGQDFGAFGGMQSGEFPYSDDMQLSNYKAPTLAVDPSGMPALVGLHNSDACFFSRFDVQRGEWTIETLDQLGTLGAMAPYQSPSLTFDTASQAAVCYVEGSSAGNGRLVVGREIAGGWTDIIASPILADSRYGTTIAAAPDGSLGFAYSSSLGLEFATYDGISLTRHTVSATGPNYLDPRSLAYDAEGNLALAYGELVGGDERLHLATRNTEGVWNDEILPAVGSHLTASVTFDGAGNPLVAVTLFSPESDGHVAWLLGQHLPIPGDLDGDGFVGGNDLDIVRSFWGRTVTPGDLLAGDPSYDGFVGGDDLDLIRANWGRGTPPAPTAVPEPRALVLLAAAGAALAAARRRR